MFENEEKIHNDKMENEAGTTKNAEDGAANTTLEDNEPAKIFTQAQVDEIVKNRLARVLKNMPSKEEVESFNILKKENEENFQIIENLKNEAELKTQRLLTYERKDIILKRGVNDKFGDFARFEAERLLNNETDFETALDAVIEENPWLVSSHVLKTGLSHGGEKIRVSSLEESFYRRNPTLRD